MIAPISTTIIRIDVTGEGSSTTTLTFIVSEIWLFPSASRYRISESRQYSSGAADSSALTSERATAFLPGAKVPEECRIITAGERIPCIDTGLGTISRA